jgi:hypothetical protein
LATYFIELLWIYTAIHHPVAVRANAAKGSPGLSRRDAFGHISGRHLRRAARQAEHATGATKDAREYHVLDGMEQAAAVRLWQPLVTSASELPATELFLKLRRGEIRALGKLLPPGVGIIDFLEDQNSYSGGTFDNLVDGVIPHDFWTMSGIDWLSNAVASNGICYCDVSMSVEALMSQFPGQRTCVGEAEFVGDFLLVKEPVAGNQQSSRKAPGRPPTFAWEAFHVEVADLIRGGRLPQKKEAAIAQMMGWFERTQGGQRPSRSAVSERLTPYYRRFFSDKGEGSNNP